MAAIHSARRKLTAYALAGRAFELDLQHREAARSLRHVLRHFPADAGPTTVLSLDGPTRGATRFSEILAATLRLTARELFPEHVLLHAAAIVGARGATLFVGPSGVGKTTIAIVAQRCGLSVLADDVACVRVADQTVLAAPVRLRARPATTRFFGQPRVRPPSAQAKLVEVVLLGAGGRTDAEVFGAQALITELPSDARWEAACQLARVIEGVPIRRMPRLVLHELAGQRRAQRRLAQLFCSLGVEPELVTRALASMTP